MRGLPPLMLPGFLIGLAAGAVVLGWLYEQARSSLFVVALWHAMLNMTSATEGTEGFVAAASRPSSSSGQSASARSSSARVGGWPTRRPTPADTDAVAMAPCATCGAPRSASRRTVSRAAGQHGPDGRADSKIWSADRVSSMQSPSLMSATAEGASTWGAELAIVGSDAEAVWFCAGDDAGPGLVWTLSEDEHRERGESGNRDQDERDLSRSARPCRPHDVTLRR